MRNDIAVCCWKRIDIEPTLILRWRHERRLGNLWSIDIVAKVTKMIHRSSSQVYKLCSIVIPLPRQPGERFRKLPPEVEVCRCWEKWRRRNEENPALERFEFGNLPSIMELDQFRLENCKENIIWLVSLQFSNWTFSRKSGLKLKKKKKLLFLFDLISCAASRFHTVSDYKQVRSTVIDLTAVPFRLLTHTRVPCHRQWSRNVKNTRPRDKLRGEYRCHVTVIFRARAVCPGCLPRYLPLYFNIRDDRSWKSNVGGSRIGSPLKFPRRTRAVGSDRRRARATTAPRVLHKQRNRPLPVIRRNRRAPRSRAHAKSTNHEPLCAIYPRKFRVEQSIGKYWSRITRRREVDDERRRRK